MPSSNQYHDVKLVGQRQCGKFGNRWKDDIIMAFRK
jgi:hypothetical protein